MYALLEKDLGSCNKKTVPAKLKNNYWLQLFMPQRFQFI